MFGSKTWSFCLIGLFLLSAPFVKGESEDSADDPDADYPEDYHDNSHPKPHTLVTLPQTIEVDEEGVIKLPCEGENLGGEHGVGVLWSRKDNQLLANDGIILFSDKDRITMQDDNLLILRDINTDDAGNYTCQASNLSVTHLVKVRESGPRDPVVTLTPTGTTVASQGDDIALACYAHSNTKQVQFNWQKKDPSGGAAVEIPNTEVTRKDVRNSVNVLRLNPITRHEAGDYVCTFEDERKKIVETVRVEVNYPPVVEVKVEAIHSPIGKATELRCTVHGQPVPTQSWYKEENGQLKQVREGLGYHVRTIGHTSTFHIVKVKASDYAEYTCFATNTFNQNGSATIEVTGAPSQPILLEDKTKLGEEHFMSYQLVWKVDSTIAIDDSVLRYRKVPGNWTDVRPLKVTKIPNQSDAYEMSYTLKNLTSGSDYEAMLLSHNQHAWSKESRIHKFHINGKSYQPLESNGKASLGGSTSLLVSTSLIALFLVFLMKTVSSWQ